MESLFERGEAFTEEENRAGVVESINAFRAAPEDAASTEY